MEQLERQQFGDGVAIETRGVVRRFGRVKALNGLDLSVKRGAVFGLIGNNGAGKTTAIHTLLGLIPANRGKMSVLGFNPRGENIEILKRVGFFPEKDEPYEWMKVKHLYKVGRHAYPGWDKKMCNELCGRFHIDQRKTIKQLSKGMVAKVKLIFALSHSPECLVLDEPTGGLDPTSRHDLLTMITELTKERSVTSLVSSHNLDDIEDIATDVGIIHEGKMIFSGSMNQIDHRFGLIESRGGDIAMPEYLEGQIIKAKRQVDTYQWLVLERDSEPVKTFMRELGSDRSVIKHISLKELFIFLTTEELIV